MAPRLLEDLAAHAQRGAGERDERKDDDDGDDRGGLGRDDVATNETGSNMPPGHVAALASSQSSSGGIGSRRVVDGQAWLPATKPLRHRFVEPVARPTRSRQRSSPDLPKDGARLLSGYEGATVVANANDPLVVYAAELAANVAWCDVPTPWNTDAVSCPRCTLPLRFATGFVVERVRVLEAAQDRDDPA
jgi:hypothetical protein